MVIIHFDAAQLEHKRGGIAHRIDGLTEPEGIGTAHRQLDTAQRKFFATDDESQTVRSGLIYHGLPIAGVNIAELRSHVMSIPHRGESILVGADEFHGRIVARVVDLRKPWDLTSDRAFPYREMRLGVDSLQRTITYSPSKVSGFDACAHCK